MPGADPGHVGVVVDVAAVVALQVHPVAPGPVPARLDDGPALDGHQGRAPLGVDVLALVAPSPGPLLRPGVLEVMGAGHRADPARGQQPRRAGSGRGSQRFEQQGTRPRARRYAAQSASTGRRRATSAASLAARPSAGIGGRGRRQASTRDGNGRPQLAPRTSATADPPAPHPHLHDGEVRLHVHRPVGPAHPRAGGQAPPGGRLRAPARRSRAPGRKGIGGRRRARRHPQGGQHQHRRGEGPPACPHRAEASRGDRAGASRPHPPSAGSSPSGTRPAKTPWQDSLAS